MPDLQPFVTGLRIVGPVLEKAGEGAGNYQFPASLPRSSLEIVNFRTPPEQGRRKLLISGHFRGKEAGNWQFPAPRRVDLGFLVFFLQKISHFLCVLSCR